MSSDDEQIAGFASAALARIRLPSISLMRCRRGWDAYLYKALRLKHFIQGNRELPNPLASSVEDGIGDRGSHTDDADFADTF